MPGPLVHFGATVTCAHLGRAEPVSVDPRVRVSGQPIVTVADPYAISGCTLPSITSGAPPCATALWTRGAARVFASGMPVILADSQATCTPTGTGLFPVAGQTRVMGA
jgi:hypothetical protein